MIPAPNAQRTDWTRVCLAMWSPRGAPINLETIRHPASLNPERAVSWTRPAQSGRVGTISSPTPSLPPPGGPYWLPWSVQLGVGPNVAHTRPGCVSPHVHGLAFLPWEFHNDTVGSHVRLSYGVAYCCLHVCVLYLHMHMPSEPVSTHCDYIMGCTTYYYPAGIVLEEVGELVGQVQVLAAPLTDTWP